MGRSLRHLIILGALLNLCTEMSAQIGQSTSTQAVPRGARTNYLFAEPNELTIVISVLGEVRAPGRYEISRNVNLLDLLALAGGWTERSDPSDVVITRVMQNGPRLERRDIAVDLSDLTQVNERNLQLEQSDIVRIGRESSFNFQELAAYISTAAVVTTAVIAILNYQRQN